MVWRQRRNSGQAVGEKKDYLRVVYDSLCLSMKENNAQARGHLTLMSVLPAKRSIVRNERNQLHVDL